MCGYKYMKVFLVSVCVYMSTWSRYSLYFDPHVDWKLWEH